ncbi:MAG: hypothetical protein IPK72_12420 [Candidatus Eisenbacteria bacterium]|nr:hypothetical protein [Candidatus Eisenbacteria bacterium]
MSRHNPIPRDDSRSPRSRIRALAVAAASARPTIAGLVPAALLILASLLSPPVAQAGTIRIERHDHARPSDQTHEESDPARGTTAETEESAAARAALDQRLAQAPQFPHLLVVPPMGDRSHPLQRTADRTLPFGAPGVANPAGGPFSGDAADPLGLLPPSILPAESRARAARMLHARSSEEWIRAQRGDGALPNGESADAGARGGPYTVRVCVLRVDFENDTPGPKTTGDGRFVLSVPEGETPPLLDPPPHDRKFYDSHMEALRRYYDVMSNGWLQLEWDIWPAENDSAIHLDDTFKYGPWIFSNSNPDILQHAIDLVGDALDAADRSAPEIDWSVYQSYILVHAGSDFQSDLNQDSPWDIPSFNLAVADSFVVPENGDSVKIGLVMVVPESSAQDGFESALNSVFAHEFGHQLGFWDLYDVSTGIPIVGAYSLMDSGTNLYALVPDPEDTTQVIAVRGTIPPSIDPWHKALYFPAESIELQELSDFVAAEDDSFETSLRPASVTNEYLYLTLNLAEYYLIENRMVDLNGDGTLILKTDEETGVILGPVADSSAVGDDLAPREYDYLIPGEGVLIWHVDQKAISFGLSQPFGGLNVFFPRPGVGLKEADGIRDIGTASNEYLGGAFDPYFVGGYNVLDGGTVPSSDSNDDTPSGMSIAVIDSAGYEMRIKVKTSQRPAGWPVLFVGESLDQQQVALDLDADRRPEVLTTSGRSVLGFRSDGQPIRGEDNALYINLAGPVKHPLSASEQFDFPAPRPTGSAVAAVAKGAVWVLEGRNGALRFFWPPVDSLVTTAAVLQDSLVWIGDRDGFVRGFVAREGSEAAVAQQVGRGAALLSIGVGRPAPAEARQVQWMAADGSVGGFTVGNGDAVSLPWSADRGTNALAGGDSGAPTPAGHLFVDLGGSDGGLHLFAWSDGQIEWRGADGRLLSGWPVRLHVELVGTPIVSDLDQDGVLETFVLERGWLVHCYGWDGLEQEGWPHSVWTEDERPFEVTSGLRAFDVNGDGAPELLQHRTDGILIAWNAQARNVAGWPISVGSRAMHGPDWVPATDLYGPRLLLGNAYGRTSDDRPVEALSILRLPDGGRSGLGFFPYPAVDLERSHVYPRDWVPTPKSTAGDLVDGSLNLYPNPLTGDALQIAFALGRPGTAELTAWDLSGKEMGSMRARAEAGQDGNRLSWDWSRFAPGLYHVRFRVHGDGFDREFFRKVAVVR